MRDIKRVLRIIGWIFAAVAVALLGGAAWSGQNQLRILKEWGRVNAQVVQSRVASAASYDRNRGTDLATYVALIDFRYSIGGKSFVTPASSQISTSNYVAMKREIDAYAPGSIHQILYNPADPNDIRFDADYTWTFFFTSVVLGGMGIVFGIVSTSLIAASRQVQIVRCSACGAVGTKGQRFCATCATPLNMS